MTCPHVTVITCRGCAAMLRACCDHGARQCCWCAEWEHTEPPRFGRLVTVWALPAYLGDRPAAGGWDQQRTEVVEADPPASGGSR